MEKYLKPTIKVKVLCDDLMQGFNDASQTTIDTDPTKDGDGPVYSKFFDYGDGEGSQSSSHSINWEDN